MTSRSGITEWLKISLLTAGGFRKENWMIEVVFSGEEIRCEVGKLDL